MINLIGFGHIGACLHQHAAIACHLINEIIINNDILINFIASLRRCARTVVVKLRPTSHFQILFVSEP